MRKRIRSTAATLAAGAGQTIIHAINKAMCH